MSKVEWMSQDADTEWLKERFTLARTRVAEIWESFSDCEVSGQQLWIRAMVQKLAALGDICDAVLADHYFTETAQRFDKDNEAFYRDYSEEGFEGSFACPEYAAALLKTAYAEELSFIFREFAGSFLDAVMGDVERLTRYMEWFLEVYSCLNEPDQPEETTKNYLEEIISSFLTDYAADEIRERIGVRGAALVPGAFDWLLKEETDPEQEQLFYRTGLPIQEEKRKHILEIYRKGDGSDRYRDAFLHLREDSEVVCIGAKGPWHKLPFFLRSVKALDAAQAAQIRLFPTAMSLVGTLVDEDGIYGPMAEAFLRQRRQDRNRFVSGRLKKRIRQELESWEAKQGRSLNDGFAMIRL